MKYDFDPELVPFINLLPKLDLKDVNGARESLTQLLHMVEAVDTSGLEISDIKIPGLSKNPEVGVRVYQPREKSADAPALLYIHGGGFVAGSVEAEHNFSAQLALQLGVVVISIEYRLAPENPYPAGLEDCYAALCWVYQKNKDLGVDRERIAVFGQSGGGGLAAALALYARDRGGPSLCFQCLMIPELDDRLGTPSAQFTDTPGWNRPSAILSWEYYLGDKYRRGADDVPYYASPARATNLKGLPPAYISTMEFDPLRDEGIAYAANLLIDGVQVELHNYPGTFHGSTLISTVSVTQRGMQEMLIALKRGLGV